MEFKRQRSWKRLGANLAFLIVFVALCILGSYYGGKLAALPETTPLTVKLIQACVVGLAVLIFGLVFLVDVRIDHLEEKQNWLINVTNSRFRGLMGDLISLGKAISVETELPGTDSTEGKTHWPWGKHHTKSLGDLEAAAMRFWTLYDASDPSTAPTNNMVADWLINERGVSKDKANAMASILRADGLPNGPRR